MAEQRREGGGGGERTLFPAKAMTMLGLACRWSSFTQALALSSEAWKRKERIGRGQILVFECAHPSLPLPTRGTKRRRLTALVTS